MLFVLTGKSGSGKDTLKNLLLHKCSFLNPLMSVTTRPMRKNEVEGKEYCFVDDKGFSKLNFLETREYCTVYGIWRYGTLAPNDFSKHYLVIGTPAMVKSLRNTRYTVRDIYLNVGDSIRLQRMSNREGVSDEMLRRTRADAKDFEGYCADFSVNNLNLSVTLDEIMRYIKGELGNEINK